MFDYGLCYRPSKTNDDEGGHTETYGTGVPLWVAVQVYDGQTLLSFRNGEDVLPKDVIGYADTYYRVLSILGNERAQYLSATVEKINRPIHAT